MAAFRHILKWLAGIFGVNLVELAAETYSTERLGDELAVDDLLQQLAARGVERPVVDHVSDEVLLEALGDRVPDSADAVDTAINGFAEALGRDPESLGGPLQSVERLDDDPSTVYLHLLEPGTDQGAYADRLDRIYTEEFGHSPRALHVPLISLAELREVDPAYFQQQAAPWLKQAGEKTAVEGGAD